MNTDNDFKDFDVENADKSTVYKQAYYRTINETLPALRRKIEAQERELSANSYQITRYENKISKMKRDLEFLVSTVRDVNKRY